MTGKQIADAIERVRARVAELNLHAALCPHVMTQGRKACRCGVSPIQALLEGDPDPSPESAPQPVYCEYGDEP